MTTVPRPEYPRPQFVREDWINLNGPWTYCFDFGESGEERGLTASQGFNDTILVPFCPESELSGVGHKDFINAMWYHRRIKIPPDWSGKNVILHIGGADYECEAYVDGQSVGLHMGGTVSFSFDITGTVTAGNDHNLIIRIKDNFRKDFDHQPGGKQCRYFASQGCSYTRTTGIWQTVWLEAVDSQGLKRVQIIPDFDGKALTVIPQYYGETQGNLLRTKVIADGVVKAQSTVSASQGVSTRLTLDDATPWCPENPFLYDIEFHVVTALGKVIDEVKSYAGLRKVHIEGNQVYLNNQPLYQRLVLDQGFYPDGIWTAPSDEALKHDILLSMQAGFNGARLHQKVFEERFHYWADKLGYLTWGESSSWRANYSLELSARNFISEWQEIVVRDRNHPSIIAWTPLNETSGYSNPKQHRRVHVNVYDLCKDLDPTRPVNDTSGYIHHITDLWTVHAYDQAPGALKAKLEPTKERGVFRNHPDEEPEYTGQPYLVDEYGGIKWIPPTDEAFADKSWGYGDPPKSLEEFYTRLEALTNVLLEQTHITGYCYTQLTDVEQEQNGIYNYDRSCKFDMERVQAVFSKNPKWFNNRFK